MHIFIIRLKSLAVGYDAAVFGKDESAEGIIFALGEFTPESMGNIIKERGTRYFPGIVIDLNDVFVCFGRIILIVNIADELLKEVVHGYNPGYSAVFVQHDCHTAPAVLHVLKKNVGFDAFGYEVGLADCVVHDAVYAALREPEIILCVEYADDIIRSLAAYGVE